MQRRVVVGTVGVLLAAVLVLGTVDTLVWLPAYLAPGIPLDRIYAALGASGDLLSCTLAPVVWLVFWGVLGALYVVLLLPVHRAFARIGLRTVAVAAIGALLLGAASFFQWWSAFAMAMSVSDALPPGVGGTTPLGMAIVLGGLVLLGIGAVLGVVVLATRRPVTAAA